MDIEKILTFGIEYLSEYFSVIVSTLIKPTLRYRPISDIVENQTSRILFSVSNLKSERLRLNPKLFSFVIISIFFGSIIQSVIPGRQSPPDLIVTVVVVIAIWFVFSCFIHVMCRVIGGVAPLDETLSVSLQVFSVLYVVSSLIALVWGVLISSLQKVGTTFTWYWSPPSGSGTHVTSIPLHHPISVYFLIQFVFLSIYLPIGLRPIHYFRSPQRIFLIIVGIIFISVFYLLVGVPLYDVTRVVPIISTVTP
jgi:hypothetical protein